MLLATERTPESDSDASVDAGRTEHLDLADPATAVEQIRGIDLPSLLLCPAHLRARALPLVAAASTPLALLAAPTGLVAATVVARIVEATGIETGIGAALAVAERLPALLVSQVLVASIARLDHPAPTMAQAVRDRLPGAQFAVLTGSVETVQGPPTSMDASGFSLIAHGSWAAKEWMTATGTVFGTSNAEMMPVAGSAQFGNRSWVELVWWRRDEVERLVASAGDQPVEPCGWCGQPRVSASCSFCGFVETATAGEQVVDR